MSWLENEKKTIKLSKIPLKTLLPVYMKIDACVRNILTTVYVNWDGIAALRKLFLYQRTGIQRFKNNPAIKIYII